MKNVVTKTKDLLHINKKENDSNSGIENKNEVYPFEDPNVKVAIDQPEARVSNSQDEPDFGYSNQNNLNNNPHSQQDILDEIHNPYNQNSSSNDKKDEINNFFKDDNQKTTENQNKYEYPKFY